MFQYVSVNFGVVHFASHVVQGLKGLCLMRAFCIFRQMGEVQCENASDVCGRF